MSKSRITDNLNEKIQSCYLLLNTGEYRRAGLIASQASCQFAKKLLSKEEYPNELNSILKGLYTSHEVRICSNLLDLECKSLEYDYNSMVIAWNCFECLEIVTYWIKNFVT